MAFVRALIVVCLMLAIPLLFLAVLWLPAQAIALTDYARGRTAPGTESFHEGMENGFRSTLASIAIDVAAIVCFCVSLLVLLRPDSRAAAVVWIAVAATASAHLVHLRNAHPLHDLHSVPLSTLILFWGIPAAIATLALGGAIASMTLAIRR